MQLKSLTLAALGLLLVNSEKFAQAASVLNNDIAIVHGGVGLAPSYLSVYGSDDDDESDFILSNEQVAGHLSKRDDTCTQYHTGKNLHTDIKSLFYLTML
jgi:hypothetical protein